MSVERLDYMGGDIDIVNAARVTFGQESDYEYWRYNMHLETFEKKTLPDDRYHFIPEALKGKHLDWHRCLAKADAGLLNYLMRERHGTPFEMVQLKFRVKAPIGVIWEWVRHRISSFNVMSTRYVEWDKDYYVPQAEDWREKVGKISQYTFAQMPESGVKEIYVEAMEAAFHYYGLLVEKGLAAEVARNVLPMGAMTQMVWSVNLRSLFNFLSLRTAPNALREIQFCAQMVEQLANDIAPEALRLWRLHDRRTP